MNIKRIALITTGALVTLVSRGVAFALTAGSAGEGDFNPLPQIQKLQGVLNVPTTPVNIGTFSQLTEFLINFKNWFFWGFFAFAIWQLLMVAFAFLKGGEEKVITALRTRIYLAAVGIVLALVALNFPTLIKSFLIGGGAVAQ